MSNFTEQELEDLLKQNSEALATVVVVNRILGSYKNEAKQCMIELMKRRAGGEDFKFEDFIKQKVEENKINLNINSIKDKKQQFVKNVIQTVINIDLSGGDNKDELFKD